MPNPYILVVDDDEDFCNLVATVLRRAGAYVVETAADGQEALGLLLDGERVPDVIVTDFQMPKMSGGDLIAHLRRNPKFARVPIAVLSGMAQAVAGADYVLPKPIALDALLSRVLGNHAATGADIAEVVNAMETSGAKARVEARASELLAEARAALEAMALPEGSRGKAWLAGAVRALGERSA